MLTPEVNFDATMAKQLQADYLARQENQPALVQEENHHEHEQHDFSASLADTHLSLIDQGETKTVLISRPDGQQDYLRLDDFLKRYRKDPAALLFLHQVRGQLNNSNKSIEASITNDNPELIEIGRALDQGLDIDYDTLMINQDQDNYILTDVNGEIELTAQDVEALAAVNHTFANKLDHFHQQTNRQKTINDIPDDHNRDIFWQHDFNFDPKIMRIAEIKLDNKNQPISITITDQHQKLTLDYQDLPNSYTSNPEFQQAITEYFIKNKENMRDKSKIEGMYTSASDMTPLVFEKDLKECLHGLPLPEAPTLDLTPLQKKLETTSATELETKYQDSEYFRLLTKKVTAPDGRSHYTFNHEAIIHFYRTLPASQSVRHYGGDPFFRDLVAGHPEFSWRLKVYDKFKADRPEREAIITQGIQDAIDRLHLRPFASVPADQKRDETIRTAVLLTHYFHDTIDYNHSYAQSGIKMIIPTDEQESYEMSQAFSGEGTICTGFSSILSRAMETLGYPNTKLIGMKSNQNLQIDARHAYIGVPIPSITDPGQNETYIFDPTQDYVGQGANDYNQLYHLDPRGQRFFRDDDYYGQDTDLNASRINPDNLDAALIAKYDAEFTQLKKEYEKTDIYSDAEDDF